MDGGARTVNNPNRVPPLLSAIDSPQEGLPRIIHPIGMPVGRPDPLAARTGVVSMDAANEGIYIESDVTHTDDAGNPFRFRAGDVVSAGRAAAFPELRARLAGDATGLARPADERPDVAPTDDPEAAMTPNPITRRMVPGAPENRMDNRRENRGGDAGYAAQTVPDLRALAERRGVAVDADAKKTDIVAALEAADRGGGE